ncbi:MAG TPA: hypothetical protein H9851_06790 [Candidatus Borkfalkia faecavium]|uniref:Uncharacterized protein n=1 Tax=Candidatus Borkfalkia faecavium TaxID=2838508 RepID=A0A9D2AVT2_9FIRM|nr:hypothetical protein [Candidatus Borkfalkia faecavium]
MPAYAEKGENLAITIHENSFELTKEFSVRKGETCRSPSFDGSAAVSPLCGAIFQGTPFIKLRRIHLHPYAHKGKTAKV